MNCDHCGASAIAGATKCYRCERPLGAAPPRAQAPARRPARAAAPSGALTVAAWSSFALAGLGLIDLVALHDSPLILAFVALQALVGLALLRRWRGAWGSALALAIMDATLSTLAMMGGRLAGILGGLCVGTLAVVGIVALAKGRAAMKRRARARASDDVAIVS